MKCIVKMLERFDKGLLIQHDEDLLFQTIADQGLCEFLSKNYREHLIRLMCEKRVKIKKEATC